MLKNRVLIVTGMHRSGTSVITQWLSKCGLPVGDRLMGAGTGNEEGHFEDLDFLDAHQNILKSRRLKDDGYTRPFKKLSFSETAILRDIIASKNEYNQQWGWKDPRTCLFLDTYRQLIPAAFYLVVWRDYQSVVSSLVLRIFRRTEKKYSTRKGLSKFIWEHFKKKRRMGILLRQYGRRYLRIWIDYNEAILAHLQQIELRNYFVTDYASLNHNDAMVFEHLVREWGFSLGNCPFKEVFKNKLMHQSFDVNKYIKDKSMIQRAEVLEEALRRLNTFSQDSRLVRPV